MPLREEREEMCEGGHRIEVDPKALGAWGDWNEDGDGAVCDPAEVGGDDDPADERAVVPVYPSTPVPEIKVGDLRL